MARYIISAGWAHSPHLDKEEMQSIIDSTPPHLVEARSQGKPTLGSGSVYPINESQFVVQDVELKDNWRRWYAMDFGWHNTAALWFAHDTNADVIYIYDAYKQGKKEPELHAAHIMYRDIKKPPIKLRGVCDPAGRIGSQRDGTKMLKIFRDCGLDLVPADNDVESGIVAVWSRLSSGKLKVIWNSNTEEFLKEYRKYRRDDNGKIVKKDDHLMDCLRYGVISGARFGKSPNFIRHTGPLIAGSKDYGL